MVNYLYVDLLIKRLTLNTRYRSKAQELEYKLIGQELTEMELVMSSTDIIASHKEAWKRLT